MKNSQKVAQKNQPFFHCIECDYYTCKKYNMIKHKSTRKHHEQTKTLTKLSKKVANYFSCEACDYYTSRKSDFNKHLLTNKHFATKVAKSSTHEFTSSNLEEDNSIVTINNSIMELTKETNELKKAYETISQKSNIVNHYNYYNDNRQITNNTNIIHYLNTDCKDAMNLSEFINNLVVTFKDLENIEKHGYIQGMKDSFLKNLREMEMRLRPIHCTDSKRKHFFVKDSNVWEKDTNHEKIHKALNDYNNKQLKIMSTWRRDNPKWKDSEDNCDKMNKMNSEVISFCSGNKVERKIIQEIVNITKV